MALRQLEPKTRQKGWISTDVSFVEGETKIDAPLAKVSIALAKALKVGRQVVSVVRFTDGKFEEVTEATFDAAPPDGPDGPDGPDVKGVKGEIVAPPSLVAEAEKPAVAASVAAPVRGCPAPDFVNAELKAIEVLSNFLTPEQLDDFQRYNRFVTRGADTGHRYMVTSRHAHDELATFGRTLYDLDENQALCVHDWVVPAAEEMLSLHLLLQLPEWEKYLRRDEHDFDLLRIEAEALHGGDVPAREHGPFPGRPLQ